MPIAVVCASCGIKMLAPDNRAGRKSKCPKCGASLVVPSPGRPGEQPTQATASGGGNPPVPPDSVGDWDDGPTSRPDEDAFGPQGAGAGEAPAAAQADFGARLLFAVREAAWDTLTAFKTLATNPVGGLVAVYEMLGPRRAMAVAVVLGILFDLSVLLGMLFALQRFMPDQLSSRPSLSHSQPTLSPGSGLSFGTIVKIIALAFIPLISITLASMAARKLFRGTGRWESDLFVAGASLQPFGLLVLLVGVLGMANFEFLSAFGVFALCCTILMLYSGCTRVHKIADQTSTLAVPFMLIASAWITKIMVVAMF